ncbi:MAG: hypothetical protein GX892_01210 [Thermoanaerobacteraceae bacterium]|nr:hypothetical protein [Thermoanaerobacteraceae bacterium]
MNRQFALRPSILCGLLLLVILAVTSALNTSPIGFSKNALFQTKTPKIILKVKGNLAWAGDNSYYNYYNGNLKKVRQSGEVIWDTELKGQLIWMGPEGILTLQDNLLLMLDSNGKELFQKSDLPDKLGILCIQNKYMLLSGKLYETDYAILLSDSGSTIWQLPLEGSIISGSVHPKGIYAALNIIDDNAKSRLVVIGPTGEILSDSIYSVPIFQVKAVSEGIGVIAGDKVFLMNNDGRLLWEYKFEGQVLRGDVGSDGFITVVVEEDIGNLSRDVYPVLIMLSRHGKHVCSYSLDTRANLVDKYGDFIYIVDDHGILVLSQEGLLVSNIKQKGIKELIVTDKNHIIAIQEDESVLFESSHGGN